MAAVERESRPLEAASMVGLLVESEGVLELIYRWYYLILGAVFIVSALIYSIRSSKTEEDAVAPTVTGPGGKPLPLTKRKKKHEYTSEHDSSNLPSIGPHAKRVFQLLSVILTLTFFANGVTIGLHSWKANRDLPWGQVNWWCGEPMVVSSSVSNSCLAIVGDEG
jgi:hypothetical protein